MSRLAKLKNINLSEEELYKSAISKWGKKCVNDLLHGWDLLEIEQGYIIATQNLVDYIHSDVISNEIRMNGSAIETYNVFDILTIDHIGDMFYYRRYEKVGHPYYRNIRAVKNGVNIYYELIMELKRFDSYAYNGHMPIKCEQNRLLLETLRGLNTDGNYDDDKLYNDINKLITCGKYPFMIYVTPNGSVRCYDIEDGKTVRDEQDKVLHDEKLLEWLQGLCPSSV